MAKDGSFYRVFANATPDRDPRGNAIGYYSVRRNPKANSAKTVTEVYRAMLEAEKKAGAKDITPERPRRPPANAGMEIIDQLVVEKHGKG